MSILVSLLLIHFPLNFTEAKKISNKNYIGELQERWQFPSDHLPIGMELEGLNVVSWNVLDAKFMHWVTEKNSQGLSRSLIADKHVYIENSTLTARDRHVVDLLLQMLDHPSQPKHLISLQECSEPFLQELEKNLPTHFVLISSGGTAVVVDRDCFEILASKSVQIFSDEPERTLQDILLQRRDHLENCRVVNVHIPGDPKKPSRYEFTDYLAKTFDQNVTTIAMGDMNFNEGEMEEAMTESFKGIRALTLYSPYCTNICPTTFYSKAIDHFIVNSEKTLNLHHPDQILIGLNETAKLLN